MSEPFLAQSLAVLERTPAVLDSLLRGLPDFWTEAADGPDTWSAHAVVGHLIHAEKADWIPRLKIILEHGVNRAFDPFDREAQFRDSAGKQMPELLDEFTALRRENLQVVRNLNLQTNQLSLEGKHPALGVVTVRQLLATWTAHDLAHLLQISRTMAHVYREDVGPWTEFLSVMQ